MKNTRMSHETVVPTKQSVLNNLVSSGAITDYDLVKVSDNGVEGEESANRNSERLTLYFANGKKLIIDTFCSGSSEDTKLFFSPGEYVN
jgi:hypothetical protein